MEIFVGSLQGSNPMGYYIVTHEYYIDTPNGTTVLGLLITHRKRSCETN